MKKFLKFVLWTVCGLLTVVLVFTGSLFFREQRLPRFIVDGLERRLSGNGIEVKIDSVSFGFRSGLRLQRVAVYDPDREDSIRNPIGSARHILVDWFNRRIFVSGASYARLPDSYYAPRTEPFVPSRVEVELPDSLPEMSVFIEDSEILGVTPERVTARLQITKDRIAIDNLDIVMPDRDRRYSLHGSFSVDFKTQMVKGGLEGAVKYCQIAPVVEVFDAPVAIPYIEAVTDLDSPIPASLSLASDIEMGSLDMQISFSPENFAYRGVPFRRAKGAIDLKCRPEGLDNMFSFTMNVADAVARDDKTMDGTVCVANDSGPVRLAFSAKSTLKFQDLLSVLEELDPAWFECVSFETAPEVQIEGTCGTGPEDLGANDFRGSVKVARAAALDMKLKDVEADFSLKRDVLSISDAHAKGYQGGELGVNLRLFLKDFDPGKFHFSISASYEKGSLEEIAETLSFDLGDRRGRVSASYDLCGFIGTNCLETLSGAGRIEVSDGRLAQMKLFAGLTDVLAERVPGISFLTEFTRASASFTIDEGVLSSQDVTVGGGLLSLAGKGTYSIPADRLDFRGELQLMSDDSFAGRFIKPLTSPFTDLLLKFRVRGPMDNPVWKYSDAPIPGAGVIKSATGWLIDWSEDESD
ncbi:MAG: hypothetical protein K6F50_00880 [Kiritimatiellae bacterium]|nr:hypothetical protein [Kiritimatiellia bacterium]